MIEMLQVPSGARCATHAEAAAIAICRRCGDFGCASCMAASEGGLCVRCSPPAPYLYHLVTLRKYILLSLAPGFYTPYFAYCCWTFVKKRDRSRIRPGLRAIFLPVTYFLLVSDVAAASSSGAGEPATLLAKLRPGTRALLSLGYLSAGVCGFLPSPWSWLSWSSLLFIAPTVVSVQQLNEARGIKLANHGMRWGHWLVVALGAALYAAAYLVIHSRLARHGR